MNFGPIIDQLYLYGFQLCRKTPIKTNKGYWAYSARNEICIHSETDEIIGLPLKRLSNTPFTDWCSFTNKLLKIRHRLTFGVVRFLWGVQLNCQLPFKHKKTRQFFKKQFIYNWSGEERFGGFPYKKKARKLFLNFSVGINLPCEQFAWSFFDI